MSKPFRWDIKKREQLGSLLDGPLEHEDRYYGGIKHYLDVLPKSCARILSMSDNSDLIFIGRSLEKAFDYLSGILSDTSWETGCVLLNVSLTDSYNEVKGKYPGAIEGFSEQLNSLGLNPGNLQYRERGIAFVDVIMSGDTFGNLHDFLMKLSDIEHIDINSIKRKVRFIAGTMEKYTSPNTHRWYQDKKNMPWICEYKPRQLRSFTIEEGLWDHLIWPDYEQRVSQCNPPWRWTDASIEYAHHDKKCLESLRLCYHLYIAGTSPEQKRLFLRLLQKEKSVRYPWFRGLISELKKSIPR